MAIGRLLSPKLTLHFNNRGFIPLTRRWLSSSLEDGRRFERLSDSEASKNKDIGEKGMHWYSFRGLLSNLKQTIIENNFLINKTSGEDSVRPKSPLVSSEDVSLTASKVDTLQNVAESEKSIPLSIKEEFSVSEIGCQDASQGVSAENKNCITSSIKEESSVSEIGTQDASQGVAAENKNCITSSNKEGSSVSEIGSQDASASVAAENKNCITSSVKEESSVSEIGTQDASESVAAEDKNCITLSIKEESLVSGMGSQDAFEAVAAEDKNCIYLRINEESSVSEMESQNASQSVAGIGTSGKRESISVNKEKLDNINRLDGLEFAEEKVLRGIQAERWDLPEEPSSKDVSLGSLTEEVSKSLVSSGENHRKLQPEKGKSDQAKPRKNSLSNLFVNSDLYKEVKEPLRFEALSGSNSSMSTRESFSDAGDQHGLFGKMLSDPVQKIEIESISNENDKQRLSDAPQNPGTLASVLLRGWIHDQKSEDLTAIRERKSIFSFESSRNTDAPLAVSSMKKLMDSLNVPTDNGADANANSLYLNGREETCVSKGNSVMQKSDRFRAKEEEESKGETVVMENQSLCSQATLVATTANPKVTEKSVALSAGGHSPNKVLLRFLQESLRKKDIVEAFSKFGAVLDVQEIPSFKGCIYKDALLTFETNVAVKKALEKATVVIKNSNAVVEATSQEDTVEKICIPDLIGDPDVPIALVKEPTRTVKIHPLTHDLSSNQIKEALRFCRSNISKFILGSSRTDAFVEFETEDGKERALAEHSIKVFNTQLFISRIDIPRTTVARISNLSKLAMRDVRALCVPYGKIKDVYMKAGSVVDVRFDVSEWPNMLTILNSLNGLEIDGKKLVVRPATTVIPPEILSVLWKDPKEKRYVKSVIQNLVREIEQPVDVTRCHTLMTDLLL